MRVHVEGACHAARALRTLIERDDRLALSPKRFASVSIELVDADVDHPHVDGVDGELERRIHAAIGKLTPSGKITTLFAAGRVSSDCAIAIQVPRDRTGESTAIERGVYQALLQYARPTVRWWRRER